ncbi:filamentous hemagglutinin N-terminal domain-containing protein [Enterobacteriaceae bacterium H4N4]|uniref:Filamentous hemagglutinin N-terminal domain-containing protein n=1 Tax=Silvania confinis TaxID=2926470 RepID=A0A9J6QDL7_9ENTR|nr:filamentous hemagglutinin N-terminal domain-containing protein [Silvania confinis]MCU6670607.1 filamentous hemagglutinin N-terminal domain-containing protein [Silvania confinis]
MFKFKLSYVALAAALTSTCVFADPVSYTHRSGANVVDIEAPNAAGVSHNLYREFNVSDKGMVLNNSGVDVNHDKLGNIAKNNNLINGAASVIINEVISNKSSALNGFIEVNGQKADVVIANPNGISCSGCNFINTDKVTMTTGKVNLGNDGSLKSYDVTGGNISVDAYGMFANDSLVLLMADTIRLNGGVHAKNAVVSVGNFSYDDAAGTVTSHNKSATLIQTLIPEYSLDISNIGGIKANNITMMGNNLGFGVRNKGSIITNTSLAMSINGNLINEGSITNNGFVAQIATAGELKNSGNITTNNIAMITANGALNNSGNIVNNLQMGISAGGSIENTGTIKSAKTLIVNTNGDLNTKSGSWLQAGEQLAISTLGNVNNGGSTSAKYTTVNFGGSSLNVTGNLSGNSGLAITSLQNGTVGTGAIYNNGSISGGDLTIQTKAALKQHGNLVADKSLSIKSGTVDNTYYISAPELNIVSNHTRNMATISGNNLDISSQQGIHNEGIFNASNNLTLSATNGSDITNYNTLQAGGVMTLNARKVENGGYKCGFMNFKTCNVGTIKTDKLILNSSHSYASNMGGNQQFKSAEINKISN